MRRALILHVWIPGSEFRVQAPVTGVLSQPTKSHWTYTPMRHWWSNVGKGYCRTWQLTRERTSCLLCQESELWGEEEVGAHLHQLSSRERKGLLRMRVPFAFHSWKAHLVVPGYERKEQLEIANSALPVFIGYRELGLPVWVLGSQRPGFKFWLCPLLALLC